MTQLTADLAQAKTPQKDTLQDELELAQSQLDLDKDELEEANEDLVAAGGNPQLRIEAMVQEHDAQVKTRGRHWRCGRRICRIRRGNRAAWLAACSFATG